jgi:protein O-mannosyl-transferase
VNVLAQHWWWPVTQSIDPDWPRISDVAVIIAPLLAWSGLALVALRCRVSRPWLSFAIVWAALHLLPLNALLPRADVANERGWYWADWGACMALAVELSRWRRFAWVALLVMAVTLGSLTMSRNAVYRSEVALWQDTVVHSPNKARPWNNLGYALQLEGRGAEAEQAYRRALALDPSRVKTANNLQRLLDGTMPKSSDLPTGLSPTPRQP